MKFMRQVILGLFLSLVLTVVGNPKIVKAEDGVEEANKAETRTEGMDIISVEQNEYQIEDIVMDITTTDYGDNMLQFDTLTITNSNLLSTKASGFNTITNETIVRNGAFAVMWVTLHATFYYDGTDVTCVNYSVDYAYDPTYNLNYTLSSGTYTYTIIGIEYNKTAYARFQYSLTGGGVTLNGKVEIECNKNGGSV